ncbi:hypothetical protein PsorP6_011709 [Peronosclerospora sorghi]|uniref:Uncharacterized protein n=1 Tax=Peronosclerospora sorghi TaxID=230839 RepID=A0ACC0WI06_9STRA|nr:hypothetical protein PsorP6_011709 [Peronosclerospora sorghi]
MTASALEHLVAIDDLTDGSNWVQVAARVFPELRTISKAKRARNAGNLLLNGQPRVSTLTCADVGDVLVYISLDKQNISLSDGMKDLSNVSWLKTCQTQGLRLVYECDYFAVVVKPAGIHVKGRGKRTVERALPLLLQVQQSVQVSDDQLPLPHAVHRLDYRVGGLLLVAKTRMMEVELSAQFERHHVTKQYRAILIGDVRKTFQGIDQSSSKSALARLPKTLQKIRDELQLLEYAIDGKPCLTAMRIVSTTRSARYDWITTVDLWPLTGRKHQLRVHSAHQGHPIVGDDLYHDAKSTIGDMSKLVTEGKTTVVRGMGLFLYSIGLAFDDLVGNRRSFWIEEPKKFARFRHFSDYNWSKLAALQKTRRIE